MEVPQVGPPQAAGGVEGHGREGFLEAQVELEASQAQYQEGIDAGGGAWVEVRAQGQSAARFDEPAGRGVVPEAQEEGGGGQEHRDHPRVGQGLHAPIGYEHEVVGAGGPQFGGQFGSPGPGEFVGVDAGPQAEGLPRGQDPPALFRGEDTLLHEDIAEAGQARVAPHQFRLPGVSHLPGAGVGHAQVFQGKLVGHHQGNVQAPAPALESAAGLQEPGFGFQVQAIAGFGLQVDDSPPGKAPQALLPQVHQSLQGGLASRGHRGPDAPSLGADLGAGDTMEAAIELSAAVPGEEQVGVGIHETRGGPAPPAIDDRDTAPVRRELGPRTQPGHAPILQAQGPVRYPVRPPGAVRVRRKNTSQIHQQGSFGHIFILTSRHDVDSMMVP